MAPGSSCTPDCLWPVGLAVRYRDTQGRVLLSQTAGSGGQAVRFEVRLQTGLEGDEQLVRPLEGFGVQGSGSRSLNRVLTKLLNPTGVATLTPCFNGTRDNRFCMAHACMHAGCVLRAVHFQEQELVCTVWQEAEVQSRLPLHMA